MALQFKSSEFPLIFVTGGCRSGKSAYAQALAEQLAPSCLYIATARPVDDEMRERIRLHQQQRGPQWRVHEIESSRENKIQELLPGLARSGEAVLFDCLTLWAADQMRNGLPTAGFARECDSLLHALRRLPCPVILVSNEVGLGIVPPAKAGRSFRDMAGLLGQKAAALADTAVLMVCGLPLALKGELPRLSS